MLPDSLTPGLQLNVLFKGSTTDRTRPVSKSHNSILPRGSKYQISKVPSPKYHEEHGFWEPETSNIEYLDPLGYIGLCSPLMNPALPEGIAADAVSRYI